MQWNTTSSETNWCRMSSKQQFWKVNLKVKTFLFLEARWSQRICRSVSRDCNFRFVLHLQWQWINHKDNRWVCAVLIWRIHVFRTVNCTWHVHVSARHPLYLCMRRQTTKPRILFITKPLNEETDGLPILGDHWFHRNKMIRFSVSTFVQISIDFISFNAIWMNIYSVNKLSLKDPFVVPQRTIIPIHLETIVVISLILIWRDEVRRVS